MLRIRSIGASIACHGPSTSRTCLPGRASLVRIDTPLLTLTPNPSVTAWLACSTGASLWLRGRSRGIVNRKGFSGQWSAMNDGRQYAWLSQKNPMPTDLHVLWCPGRGYTTQAYFRN